jgi:hypothetical protein
VVVEHLRLAQRTLERGKRLARGKVEQRAQRRGDR